MDNLFWNVTVPVNTGDQFQLGFSDNNRFYVTQLGPRELDADIHVVICEYVLGTECKTHFHIFCVYIFLIMTSMSVVHSIWNFARSTAMSLACTNEISQDLSLTHWGRVTHICVNKITIIGSDNGLSPGRRQAIIWTNAGILLNGPQGTNFSEILIEINTFSLKKWIWKCRLLNGVYFVSVSMC